ncbi:Aspartate-semialdehyde dehydrogenase [Lentibacillus sp. JNUCC-1]|uniref:aspartate-semialdehyde dehydrogenase n=1 Tax=Lentibacillus sp. JNUCC-1 TaxID=2654513 RepID=UPI0012E89261|nr:aspartate-semialdehyde dehydrogenase [Lentibacillus sp. JNUCC-1]MUV37790.1 Aspartate-semialdehyde dehydrogenase [Lentibacillus sp. JNUCC-1]
MVDKESKNIAVVGATGAVGEEIIRLLEKSSLQIGTMKLLASKRSQGKKVTFRDTELTIEEATPNSFENIDIALFSAGGSISRQLAEAAVSSGAVVIDNTSAFRMDENVPLVVPEVNHGDLDKHNGIIANPNCSTIQMVTALNPLKQHFGLKRIIVSTYQAVSGAGLEANEELAAQTGQFLKGEDMTSSVLPVKGDEKHYPIAFNALPQIDVFTDNGFTFEEMKMVNETKKLLHMPDLAVSATCVRLPIFRSHAESIYIEVEQDGVSVADLKRILKDAPGVVLEDDPDSQLYPTPLSAEGKDDVFVGRIRKDLDNDRGFHLWVVSDNLLKGAALNTVQIAEKLAGSGQS